jgi:hypothetical protein
MTVPPLSANRRVGSMGSEMGKAASFFPYMLGDSEYEEIISRLPRDMKCKGRE